MSVGLYAYQALGRIAAWFWARQQNCRAWAPELRELDAFRALATLEPTLAEWPRAIPLLEQARMLYEATNQMEKRDQIEKRLKEAKQLVVKMQTGGGR